MKIGIDIGGSHIGVGIVDNFGNILAKKEEILEKINGKISVEKDKEKSKTKQESKEKIEQKIKEKIVQIIIKNINELITKNSINIENIEYIGIAFPKSLRNFKIGKAVNLGISGYEVKEEIQNIINKPVYIKNDAKCAAICEKEYGSLKKYENAVFLTIGTGIGGATFLNDKLLTTSKNDLFKIGHMTIRKDGVVCKCGKKGCFEKYASITALKNEVVKAYKLNKDCSGEEIHKFILENMEDEKMKKIIEEYIENLYIGLSNIINLFEPEVISIGGSFAYYKEIFLEKLQNKLSQNAKKYGESNVKIIMAKYKNDAGIIGATRIVP